MTTVLLPKDRGPSKIKGHGRKSGNTGPHVNLPILPSGPFTMLGIYKATVGVCAKALLLIKWPSFSK